MVLAHVFQIFICADTTKETGGREREKKPALLLPMHLLCLQLFLSPLLSKAIYGQLLFSLPASQSVPSEGESDDAEGENNLDVS